ncbi:hypothetical protein M2251_000067 [Rhodococcus erythropolis]|nr:hypothetical protein [Rhodococcus erythropolis]
MSTACDKSAQTFFASVVGRWWTVRGSPVTYRSVIEVNLLVERFSVDTLLTGEVRSDVTSSRV